MKLTTWLFAAVGAGLVALAAGPIRTRCGPSKEASITQVEISEAAAALTIYHLHFGAFPSETNNARLVKTLEGDNPGKRKFYILDRKRTKTDEFTDGWGRSLMFRTIAARLSIRSSGQDGIFYNEDDVVYDAVRPPAPHFNPMPAP